MKRVLSFVLILALIVPVLLVPVLAATVYEFSPAPFALDQFDFPYGGEYMMSHFYEGAIPEGRYVFSFALNDNTFISEPFDLVYAGSDQTLRYADISFYIEIYGESGAVFLRLIHYFESDVCFLGYLIDGDFAPAEMGDSVCFVSVDSEGVFSFLSQDLMHDVLMQVVALTPVVLGVIVLALGIRKGVGFLMALIRGS